jgi:hypothetical protein
MSDMTGGSRGGWSRNVRIIALNLPSPPKPPPTPTPPRITDFDRQCAQYVEYRDVVVFKVGPNQGVARPRGDVGIC